MGNHQTPLEDLVSPSDRLSDVQWLMWLGSRRTTRRPFDWEYWGPILIALTIAESIFITLCFVHCAYACCYIRRKGKGEDHPIIELNEAFGKIDTKSETKTAETRGQELRESNSKKRKKKTK